MSGGPNTGQRLYDGTLSIVDMAKRTYVDFGLDLQTLPGRGTSGSRRQNLTFARIRRLPIELPCCFSESNPLPTPSAQALLMRREKSSLTSTRLIVRQQEQAYTRGRQQSTTTIFQAES